MKGELLKLEAENRSKQLEIKKYEELSKQLEADLV